MPAEATFADMTLARRCRASALLSRQCVAYNCMTSAAEARCAPAMLHSSNYHQEASNCSASQCTLVLLAFRPAMYILAATTADQLPMIPSFFLPSYASLLMLQLPPRRCKRTPLRAYCCRGVCRLMTEVDRRRPRQQLQLHAVGAG